MQQNIQNGLIIVHRGALLLLLVIVAARAPLFGQATTLTGTIDENEADRVAGKTYDLRVSRGFDPQPFEPFHDCLRFTKTTITTDVCGDTGPLSEIRLGSVTLWQGTVPCGGLNLRFTGTSKDGPEIPVLGGVVVGISEKTNFGIEGVENASCSLSSVPSSAPSRGGNPYAKGH
jgi:hypothetical protein